MPTKAILRATNHNGALAMASYVDYANSERQKEIGRLMDEGLSSAQIAEKVGADPGNIRKAMRTIRARAAKKGHAPEHDMRHTVPDGYAVKGTSTLYKEGQPVLQWVKTNQDAERQLELMQAAVAELSKEIPPSSPIKKPKRQLNSDLLNLYTLTDCHVGMLAWHREGGADWDLKIAEETLVGAFIAMMDGAPNSEYAIVGELGDFEHFDGFDAVTPTNRHQLDADGRFPKIIETSIRIRRRFIDEALKRHKKVICLMAEGNHNIVSSMWMRKMFAALYINEPRVEIIDTEIPYYAYQFGKVMLGWHHGHKKPNHELPLLFASQFPEIWGATKYRHAHTGHRHHMETKEHSGMTVYQHQTMAARDAHASHGGYISDRAVDCMTYHKEHGHVASNFVKPSMLSS